MSEQSGVRTAVSFEQGVVLIQFVEHGRVVAEEPLALGEALAFRNGLLESIACLERAYRKGVNRA